MADDKNIETPAAKETPKGKPGYDHNTGAFTV